MDGPGCLTVHLEMVQLWCEQGPCKTGRQQPFLSCALLSSTIYKPNVSIQIFPCHFSATAMPVSGTRTLASWWLLLFLEGGTREVTPLRLGIAPSIGRSH